MIRFLLVLCAFQFCVFSAFAEKEKPQKQVFLYSLPKAGTHLVMKLIYLLTEQSPRWLYDGALEDNEYYWFHHPYPDEYKRILNNPNYLIVVSIRDLRDVCVSTIRHLCDSENSWKNRDEFKQLSFHDQLMTTISDVNIFSPRGMGPNFLQLMREPNVYVIRFEDLVGPEGGGDREAQVRVIRGLADRLGLFLTEQKIQEVASLVFGKKGTAQFSKTFDKGLIGRWKTKYTEDHKEVFKKYLGNLLIDMGYEQDQQW